MIVTSTYVEFDLKEPSMEQLSSPNVPAAPTFWQTVVGTILGNLGCFLAYLFLFLCVAIVFSAVLGPQIGNVFSRITNGLNAP